MRYLSRNKVYEKIEVNKDAKKVYIFCEGEDKEVKYFKYFQGFSSNIDIIPIPNTNGQSDPLKLKENARLLFEGDGTNVPKFKLSEEYKDEVWFVIDTDRWNERNKIEQLRDFCKLNNKDCNSWYIVQSNPCFELWLYYHIHNIKPSYDQVKTYASFKEFVNDTIKGGFDNRTMPFEISSAIENSRNNFQSEKSQPDLYSTEVHLLGMVILPFVESQLKLCRERMSNNL